MARPSSKNNQRGRILRAMTEVVAREGYTQASIAQTISLARVSRSTFYENFEDKLDCFLAVEHELGSRALSMVEAAVLKSDPDEVAQTAVSALVGLVEEEPAGARLILSESLAAGARAMDKRDELMARIGELVEGVWKQSTSGPALDLPAQVLVGGVCRLLSVRILHGPGRIHAVLPDLLRWANSYTRTAGEPRWRALTRGAWRPLSPSPHAEIPPAETPDRLPAGRHNLPTAYVSANQRARIIHATVRTLMKKGYTATTVADIVATAQLTRGVFYQHFRDKEDLLSEINQGHFQQMMAVTARAFFSEERWPERTWAAVRAGGDLYAAEPDIAHIAFIETSAVGPELARLVNEIVMAFAVFLEEGYHYRPHAATLPRLCSEAIAASLCELMYVEIRGGRAKQSRELVPYVAYLALAPFMGPEEGGEFVESKLQRA